MNVNPAEPPMPGKVEYEQAKKFALALLTSHLTAGLTVGEIRLEAETPS